MNLPWPEEKERVESLVTQPGGKWVVAAACIDYAYLTDISVSARLAHGPGSMRKPSEERLENTIIYMNALESDENRERVDAAISMAWDLAQEIPRTDFEAIIDEGNWFLAQTAGHCAVIHFVDAVKTLSENQATQH